MKPKKSNVKDYLFFGIAIYLLAMFATMHYCAIVAAQPDIDMLAALNMLSSHMLTQPFNVVFDFETLGTITIVGVLGVLLMYSNDAKNKHDMAGKEAGSAHWNTDYNAFNKKYNTPFGKTANNGDDNMILSQNLRLSMNGSKTRLNNNILIIGGSGSGKSRFEVKPNLLQMNASFVVTDPKGELLETIGGALEKEGYVIKVFNTIQMQYSNHYNPFYYIVEDEDILVMVNTLILNTTPKGASGGDPFWTKSETALLTAIAAYLLHACPLEDCNWANVMRLIELASVDEDNPEAKSDLDCMFDAFEAEVKEAYNNAGERYEPDLATRQYAIYKKAAGKTAKSILISAAVRLAHFQLSKISNLTNTDDIDLTHIGDKKTALFCVVSASDTTFNYLVSLMYTQLFNQLYLHAQNEFGGALPVPVRFLLDEFANIGTIPEFDKKLATMRSYRISCTIILQSLGQLKTMYKDEWETIMGNCDTKIFLGGNDETTTKYLSGLLGKATITAQSRGHSTGGKGSASKNYNQTARDLLTQDEVGLIDNSYEIVMIRSLSPFYDKKYDYPKHPKYSLTGDADAKQMYPFREKFEKLNAEAEEQKQKEKDKKLVTLSCRSKAQMRRDLEARCNSVARAPVTASSGGRPLLHPCDAEAEIAADPHRKETLIEANLPVSFDAAYEFNDGKEITDDEFLKAMTEIRIVCEGSENLVEANINS